MNNKGLKIVLLLVCIVAITAIGIAQPPAGPPPGGGITGANTPPCWAPECVPIDGGLSFLLAAGALLGFKSLKGKK
ncbi:hypothetical protein DNU06_00200 [Putridiphycobacter roseus]|uniref:Uncharacterized protein n=1 Tax=Putridiphycobacter roseus TaxID=2219161 RepID=A0A2W1N594_9FLAO|nr:hypothetical protein [Putridiphycobacter roseus]PZE18291.1 hypothetical protein DNU06_00200 [Putridiphycobacter roseus]